MSVEEAETGWVFLPYAFTAYFPSRCCHSNLCGTYLQRETGRIGSIAKWLRMADSRWDRVANFSVGGMENLTSWRGV